MRHFLISALLLSLVAGCSSVNIGPHRIDVQQGNALDQESVARLKPGLNRSQVRFLLGTPLVVDPFRTDRWDYVYVFYKAGKLAEQKRISLFFEGDTLVRIEGDVPEPTTAVPAPAPVPAPKPQVKTAPTPVPLVAEALPDSASPAPQAVPIAAASLQQEAVVAAAARPASATVPAPAATPAPAAAPTTSIVSPLPSPKDAPAYANRRPTAALRLQPETDVTSIQPDVMPAFPNPGSASGSDAPVLHALNTWVNAWVQRDEDAYMAAYDASFVPQGGGSRADWEKRRRLLFGLAKNIDLRIDAPAVERLPDGGALVTFNQFYRSDNYRDAVVKQLRMVERDEGWLIAEERVLSVLRNSQP